MRAALLPPALALAVCLAVCGRARAAPPAPACATPPDPGPCRAFFRRFFWDNATAACEPFIYGGCDGSVPFRTAAECEAARCGGGAAAHGAKGAGGREGAWEAMEAAGGAAGGAAGVEAAGVEVAGGAVGGGAWWARTAGERAGAAPRRQARLVRFRARTLVV